MYLIELVRTHQIGALLFDCDGTLAHTMPLHNQAWHETLAQFGLELPPGALDEFSGMPTVGIVGCISERYSVALDPFKVSEMRDARVDELMTEVKPVAPVVAVVEQFRNLLPMAVISGGIRRHVDQTLRLLNIYEQFPIILTAESPFSPKPAPDLFLAAASQLGVEPSQCMVFEDGQLGIDGAKAAGMLAFDVRTLPDYLA